MRWLVVGGCGFIGSHLVDALVRRGDAVSIVDDLSNGRRAFVEGHLTSGAATLHVGSILDLSWLQRRLRGHDVIVHLAANPEARHGLTNPRLDLEQGTIGTWNVLEAARRARVPRVVLASSGTVYGNTAEPCAEGDLGKLPISLYGASKLASEAMLSAYVESFGLEGLIVRFGNVVGPRGTHGAALDFLHKLKRTGPTGAPVLEVLGDGDQAKPYVYVTDCVAAILHADALGARPLGVYNIAPDTVTSVRTIAELCVAASPYPAATIVYTGGRQGWPGDVPRSRLNADALATLGYRVPKSSDDAVRLAVKALAAEVFGG